MGKDSNKKEQSTNDYPLKRSHSNKLEKELTKYFIKFIEQADYTSESVRQVIAIYKITHQK